MTLNNVYGILLSTRYLVSPELVALFTDEQLFSQSMVALEADLTRLAAEDEASRFEVSMEKWRQKQREHQALVAADFPAEPFLVPRPTWPTEPSSLGGFMSLEKVVEDHSAPLTDLSEVYAVLPVPRSSMYTARFFAHIENARGAHDMGVEARAKEKTEREQNSWEAWDYHRRRIEILVEAGLQPEKELERHARHEPGHYGYEHHLKSFHLLHEKALVTVPISTASVEKLDTDFLL